MKKLQFGLPVLAIVVAFAASAFTNEPVKVKSSDPLYHWFSPNGTYLGQRSVADQEVLCPGTGQLCANGYNQINQNEEPVGAIAATTQKQ